MLGFLMLLLGAVLVLAEQGRRAVARSRSAPRGLPVMYANIVLLNKKQAVKSAVDKRISKGLFGFRRKVAASVAASVYSDTKFTRKVAAGLAEGIPRKFEERTRRKIGATARVCFARENFTVIGVGIERVDRQMLEEHPAAAWAAGTALKVARALGIGGWADYALDLALCTVAERKVREILGSEIVRKLREEAGIESEVEVVDSALEAAFFFDTIADDAAV